MSNKLLIKAQALMLTLVPVFAFATAQADDVRQSNNQYGVSFQPPPGWRPDPVAQYVGQQRKDGTAPMLTLVTEDRLRELSEGGIDGLTKEVRDEIASEGIESAQITDRQKQNVAGRAALLIDATYKIGDVQLKQRRVYVPVGEQNRTYLFIFVDTAQYFDQSVAAANAAINSFSLGEQTSGAGARPATDSGERKLPLALLIALGILALALVAGAGYLLLQRRASAH